MGTKIRAWQNKWSKMWEKNGPDIRAAFSGDLPRFLRSSGLQSPEHEAPVFVFHTVQPSRFEAQLAYLARNGYETLDADSLVEHLHRGRQSRTRQIALTFDDATASAWTVAYPLLKKYGFRATLFAVPGLIPERAGRSINLEDMWVGKAGEAEVLAREPVDPLCTWEELSEMDRSGVFNVQSHSLSHSRVSISPKITDFLHPKFDRYLFGNVNIPVSVDEPPDRPVRPLILGAPVYESAPRLGGRPRYLEDLELRDLLVDYVARKGGAAFFENPGWRGDLYGEVKRHRAVKNHTVQYEDTSETREAVRRELGRSKQILEDRLGKKIDHFCYPWFHGSNLSDQIAAEYGYRVVYYGLPGGSGGNRQVPGLFKVHRVSEEYLQCLPGVGRKHYLQVWLEKLKFSGKKNLHYGKRDEQAW